MTGESKRQQRFANVIQKDLSELFQHEGSNWAPGAFITVTKVRMTPDLSIARIYLSFLDSKTKTEKFEQIQQNTSKIRYKLGNKIRHDIKAVPELEFYIDDTSDYVENMDRIFDEIKKENNNSNDDT
ncbi:MAG TPA: 30S ribosome-binding factor RbfA [Sphingobacterium sp.]|nr:30S ribosome-binding factor RbfA [Sphingobacterium sp.]